MTSFSKTLKSYINDVVYETMEIIDRFLIAAEIIEEEADECVHQMLAVSLHSFHVFSHVHCKID